MLTVGRSGHSNTSASIWVVGEVTPDGKFSLTCLCCVGACGLAPVIEVGEKVYGRMTPDRVKDVLAEYK